MHVSLTAHQRLDASQCGQWYHTMQVSVVSGTTKCCQQAKELRHLIHHPLLT